MSYSHTQPISDRGGPVYKQVLIPDKTYEELVPEKYYDF